MLSRLVAGRAVDRECHTKRVPGPIGRRVRGDGRVYTISITCTEGSENSSHDEVNITVAHVAPERKSYTIPLSSEVT